MFGDDADRDRHPLLEWGVFGAALALAAILVFYGVRGCRGRKTAPVPSAGAVRAGLLQPQPPVPVEVRRGSFMESGVSSIPPVRLSSLGGGQRRRVDVPAPAGAPKKK